MHVVYLDMKSDSYNVLRAMVTVKIPRDTRIELIGLKAQLQKSSDRHVTFADAVSFLLNFYRTHVGGGQ